MHARTHAHNLVVLEHTFLTYTVEDIEGRKEENAYLTTHSTHFYLWLYGVGHMVKVHSEKETGNPLPPFDGGAGRSIEVERSLMVRWVVGSILHGVDPLSYFSFQPVLHDLAPVTMTTSSVLVVVVVTRVPGLGQANVLTQCRMS